MTLLRNAERSALITKFMSMELPFRVYGIMHNEPSPVIRIRHFLFDVYFFSFPAIFLFLSPLLFDHFEWGKKKNKNIKIERQMKKKKRKKEKVSVSSSMYVSRVILEDN